MQTQAQPLMKTRAFLPSLFCLLVFLGGCAGMPAVEAPPSQAARDTMAQVRQQYADGQYGNVIRTVATSDDIAAAPGAMRIEAHKLLAFSYCVRGYAQLCEDTFVRILQWDPAFMLAPSEAGHPQWGPVFKAARARAGR